MDEPLNKLLDKYIDAYSKGEDSLRAFWEYVISKELMSRCASLLYTRMLFLATRKTKQSLPVMVTAKKPTQPKMQSSPGHK